MKDDSNIDTKNREYISTGDRLRLNFNFQEV